MNITSEIHKMDKKLQISSIGSNTINY